MLHDEISTDPLGLGYATWLPDSPGTVAELLNAKSFVLAQEMVLREIDVIGQHPDGPEAGDAVLAKLEAFGATSQPLARIVARALRALSAEGLNVGSESVRSMLTTLGQAGALTVDEADKLMSMADQPASRAQVLGLGVVTVEQVIGAI